MFHSDTHIDLHQPGPSPDGSISYKVTKSQVMAALAVSMGSMIVGFCSAWSSPAIASLMEDGSKLEVCTH
jgi:facilitated trehalose transporter